MSDKEAGGSGMSNAATRTSTRVNRSVLAILDLLNGLLLVSAGTGFASFAIAAVLTVTDIIGRQVGWPIVGIVDLVQLCVLGGAWLVIPYAFLKGSHVGVDLLVQLLPHTFNRFFKILANLAAAVLLLLMLGACIEVYSRQALFGDRSQQLGIPITWYWLPLLTGVVLSILAVFLSILNPIFKKKSAL